MNCVLSILILSTVCSVAYSGGCIYAKFTPEHTLCKPPNTQCNLLANTVSNDDKNLIIKLHNDFRSKVASGQETTGGQPKAADMKQLEWDSNLANVAQKHAEQCVYGHDCKECRLLDGYSSVGQNAYVQYSTGNMQVDWNKAVNKWYSEVVNFASSRVPSFMPVSGPMTGHYTQVVWGETGKIGCGFARYPTQKPGYKTEQLYICNYAPAGNVETAPVYTIGEPCSNCPNGYSCSSEYKGLCKKN
uniref:U25-Liphistoxin-Lm1h_1 n=1 Tax=Liphistius malayanus TaxID=1203467 RepID=A0A482ZDZ1_9ARAC